MSWSDDIRCLYCDGRLPLYRKITNGQFCSTPHRKAYWQEQERLAVERLHQTHDTLHAYRPAGGVESILGRAAISETPEEVLPACNLPDSERPWWLILINTGQVPEANLVRDPVPARPRWPLDGLAGSDPEPLDYAKTLRSPLYLYQPKECGFAPAETVGLDVAAAELPMRQVVGENELVPLNVAIDLTMDLCGLLRAVSPEEYMVGESVEEEDTPPFATLVALPLLSARESLGFDSRQVLPAAIILRAQLPLDAAMRHATLSPAALLQAGLRELPMDRLPLAPRPWVDSLRAMEVRAELEAPLFTISTPPARPRLKLASGRRYPVQTRQPASPMAQDTGTLEAKAPGISLPKRNASVAPAASPAPMHEPNPAGMVSMAGIAKSSGPSIEMRPAPVALSLPQPARTEPIRPRSRLKPLNPRPAFDLTTMPPPVATLAAGAPETRVAPETPAAPVQPRSEPAGSERANIWIHAIDFWNRAPRDLKMLTIAIPVLLGLALHPSLPKVRVAAPATASGFQRNFQRAMNEQFVNVRQTVLDRAAVALDEDFRSGLDEWASPGDATTDWSFDATGFVRPGPLALYKPSVNLTDYQLQFLGMIDKKALSWVVRASDFQNFYVVKLVVLKAGPLPSIGLTRYAVVNGKADSRVDTVVPVDAREDMLYRVRLDVHDSDFSLSVQGQFIDAWSEPRLPRGGVGFFSARGEESRLRWVQVTHQYDMLGRLCAYLAPYNFSSTNNGITSTSGSWQP